MTVPYLGPSSCSLPYKYHLIALSEYHTFTTNLTNEARLGYNRYETADPSGPFTYPGLAMFPNITIYDQGQTQLWPGLRCSAVDDPEPVPGHGQHHLHAQGAQLQDRV